MSHTFRHHTIGKPFIILSSVESTNNYAMARLHTGSVSPGTAYFAIEQTAGKGQRGKIWSAQAGKNITMSVILQPPPTCLAHPFLLSATIALACYHFCKKYVGSELSIKWPNDILWRDRKAGGLLFENIYRGNKWMHSIAGIGININQITFPPVATNAVSIQQITAIEYDVFALAKELCGFIEEQITLSATQSGRAIMKAFNRVLYQNGKTVKLKKDNNEFAVVIKGVSAKGQLITKDSIERRFDFGEIEWVPE